MTTRAVIAATAVFALAYTRYPLYHGNYNTYLLHGLACGGRGFLADDWLAGTRDPFPLVSAVACGVYRLGQPWLFHALHASLLGVYLVALTRLVADASGFAASRAKVVALGGLLVVAHSVLFRDLVAAATGGDWAWYLQSGVAMQYLLGFVFQPSLWGVLIVASLAAFVRGRDALAVALALGAVAGHFSYLPTVAALLAGCAWVRRSWRPWTFGYAPLGLLTAWVWLRFGPTDPDTAERARALLADVRIPHHAQPARWLQPSLWIQLPLVAAGLFVARRTPLGRVLLVLAVAALGLTLLQVATESRTLALLFPWRTSVVLVPVSTALLLGRLVAWRPTGRIFAATCAAGALAAAIYGEVATARDRAAWEADPALPAMSWVRGTATATDLYVIPTDLQRFRLETGARTFVDWKSHPFLDRELLIWHERVEAARAFERASMLDACHQAAALVFRYGATHFVVPAARAAICPDLALLYADRSLAVLAVAPPDPHRSDL